MSVDGREGSGPDGLARTRPERALLLAVDTGSAPWSITESLDELEELARTAGAEVELPRLEYLLPRLTRAWTHLERQVGGIGVRGGPGETQIEIDRRLTRTRIAALKKEIEGIRGHRAGQRSARERAGLPVVAIIG